jgi:hypothetical protein
MAAGNPSSQKPLLPGFARRRSIQHELRLALTHQRRGKEENKKKTN